MNRPLISYLLYFAFAYVGMLILFTIISMFISSAGSSGTVIAPFLSAMMIGEFFIKKEQRAPDDAERNYLTLGSFAIFVVLNLALAGLVIFGGGFAELQSESDGNTVLLIIIGAVCLILFPIVFFMMRWAYGGLTRKRAAKLLGEQNKTFD